MTKKQYKELAEMLENKATQWLAVDVTDFLQDNFDNFDREKFMKACGFDRAYSHDEMLTMYFSEIEDFVNQSVKLVRY